MVSSSAKTVDEYLASLPPDRRQAVSAVRDVILKNLPKGYKEGMHYGMIGYCIPLERYPNTYNGQPLGVAAIASQKQYMSVYLHGCYADASIQRWFEGAFRKAGKKLDMGKSCVRFRKLDDLPLDVIGQAVARMTPEDYIALYERVRGITGKGSSKKSAKKASTKTSGTKKTPSNMSGGKASASAASKKSASEKKSSKKPSAKKTSAKKSTARPASATSSTKAGSKKSPRSTPNKGAAKKKATAAAR